MKKRLFPSFRVKKPRAEVSGETRSRPTATENAAPVITESPKFNDVVSETPQVGASESQQLTLIANPGQGVPQAAITNAKAISIPKTNTPALVIDPPEGPSPSLEMPPEAYLNLFTVDIGPEWVLDGERLFTNGEYLFTDQVISDNYWDRYALTAIDPHTRITDPGQGEGHFTEGFRLDSTRPKPLIHLDGHVGIAVGFEAGNWGSCVTRFLPRLIQLKELGCERILCFIAYPSQRELLNLIGWDDSQIIPFDFAANYSFSHGTMLSEPTENLFLDTDAMARIRRQFPPHPNPTRMIYVARSPEITSRNPRALTNASEVELMLTELGFEVIYPEKLTPAQQIETFANAKFIVGPSGAGMFNVVFANPGTKVIEIESEADWYHGHHNLFSSTGMQFGFVWGTPDSTQPPPHRPFKVDVTALKSAIITMLESPTTHLLRFA